MIAFPPNLHFTGILLILPRVFLLLRYYRRDPRLARRTLDARRFRHGLRKASWRPHSSRSTPHHLIPCDRRDGRESHHNRVGSRKALALHGSRRLRGRPMLRDHDLHDRRERIPARLLPEQVWRGQRLGGRRSHLGGLHGVVHPAAVGAEHRSGKGARHPSGHHFRRELCDCLPAILRPAHQAMAGEGGPW